jgi:hypothetical protein
MDGEDGLIDVALALGADDVSLSELRRLYSEQRL